MPGHDLVGRLPVGLEVVLPAEQIVIPPGRMRGGGVDTLGGGRFAAVTVHRSPSSSATPSRCPHRRTSSLRSSRAIVNGDPRPPRPQQTDRRPANQDQPTTEPNPDAQPARRLPSRDRPSPTRHRPTRPDPAPPRPGTAPTRHRPTRSALASPARPARPSNARPDPATPTRHRPTCPDRPAWTDRPDPATLGPTWQRPDRPGDARPEGFQTPSRERKWRGGGEPWASIASCQAFGVAPKGRAAAMADTSV